jgi:hypothetical protein
MTSCRDFAALLSPFVDGDLAGDERAAVVAHLDGCAVCRGIVSDLERLRAAARLLGPVAPPDHLRRQVAARVRLDAGRPEDPAAVPASTSRAAWPQWVGLAAALVLVTFSVYLVGVLQAPQPAPTEPTPGTGTGSVAVVAQELKLALEHYDKAIAELQIIAKKDEGTLDPELRLTLQRNLTVIDRAIADSRQALERDPASEPARETLLDALQRKIGVLQTTVALVGEMGKGNAAGAARVIGGKS